MNNIIDLHEKVKNFNPGTDASIFRPFKSLDLLDADLPAFPIDYLGPLKAVVIDIAAAMQIPVEAVALCCLTSAAVAVQALFDVEIDGRKYPSSLYGLTIMGSGERKTAVEFFCTEPIAALEKRLQEQENRRAVEDPLYRRQDPQLLSSDPTIEGICKGFDGGQKSQGLFSSEGGMFFGGYGMSSDNLIKTLAGLSALYDGQPIRRKRSGKGENVLFYGCRLSMHLMVQPSIYVESFRNCIIREQGFAGRLLIVKPKSLRGFRPYKKVNVYRLPSYQEYQKRLNELLGDGNPDALGVKAITLSADAYQWWVDFYNQTEQLQQPGQRYESVPEPASKIAETAARIACVLAALYYPDLVEIDVQSMINGIYLAQYFLDVHLHLSSHREDGEDYSNAKKLWAWIVKHYPVLPGGIITKQKIQNSGPPQFRKDPQLILTVMEVLVENGYAKVERYYSDSTTPKSWVVREL